MGKEAIVVLNLAKLEDERGLLIDCLHDEYLNEEYLNDEYY